MKKYFQISNNKTKLSMTNPTIRQILADNDGSYKIDPPNELQGSVIVVWDECGTSQSKQIDEQRELDYILTFLNQNYYKHQFIQL